MEKLLNINELCEVIGAKRQTVYRWVHESFIPTVKVGGLVRFRPSDIENWLNKKNKRHNHKENNSL